MKSLWFEGRHTGDMSTATRIQGSLRLVRLEEEDLIKFVQTLAGWKRSGLYVPRMACHEKQSGFLASVLALIVAVCWKAQCEAGGSRVKEWKAPRLAEACHVNF